MKKFASRLKEKQLSLGISQIKMAELIGVAPGTLSAYLKDEKCPTLEKAAQIAEALGVTVGWLCGEDIERPKRISEIDNYGDWVEAMVEIIDLLPLNKLMIKFRPKDANKMTPEQILWTSRDPLLVKHFGDSARLLETLNDGVIEDEVYNAWHEKRINELKKIPLPSNDEGGKSDAT